MEIEIIQMDHKDKLTFGRIEASNLDYVIAFRPFQLCHFLLGTQAAEFAHVEL
jgi:hypothetical protein